MKFFTHLAAIILGAFIVLGAPLSASAPDCAQSDDFFSSVLRLHIRANSDSEADQSLKLTVRDELLSLTSTLFADCEDLADAKETAILKETVILENINSTLAAAGAEYGACISLGIEHFPERTYGERVYPEGEYTALIVELGEGKGQNWWCVLFPSLCLSPASDTAGDALEVGLTPDQYRTITGGTGDKYQIKFRFLELLVEFFDR